MNMGSMLVNSPHDLTVFLLSFVCGQVIGIVFDIFRAFRIVYPPGKNMIAAQDIIFCALAFYLFSQTVEMFNFGDVRWFEIAGVVLGFFLYLSAESGFVKPILTAFFRLLNNAVIHLSAFFAAVINFAKKLFKMPVCKIETLYKRTKNVFSEKCTKKRAKKQ